MVRKLHIFVTVNSIYNYDQLSGVNTGLSSSPAAIYSTEIAVPKLRGRLACFTSLSIALGVLIIYILGYVFPVSQNKNRMWKSIKNKYKPWILL